MISPTLSICVSFEFRYGIWAEFELIAEKTCPNEDNDLLIAAASINRSETPKSNEYVH